MSGTEGKNVRGRPPVKLRDRVQEYVRKRGEGSLRNPEQARRDCQDRERWKLFCRGHPLVGAPRSRRRNELNGWLLKLAHQMSPLTHQSSARKACFKVPFIVKS